MRNGRTGFVATLLALLFGVSVASETFVQDLAIAQALGPMEAPASPATIRLLLALGWEGRDLNAFNLEALRAFRGRFRDVSLTHFLSPAYFTQAPAARAEAAALIRSVMRPKDQLALALGGWRSLATAAGVLFRSDPTFWGQPLKAKDCVSDCGLEVPVNIYPDADLAKLLQTSMDTLDLAGFGRPKGLAVEGWVASPPLLEAAARAGIRYDFSAVSAELLTYRARLFPVYGWVKALWPEVTPHTQPFLVSTAAGGLMEIPQSLASLDYYGATEVMTVFKEYVERAQREPGTDLAFPLVIYQENAMMTLPTLARSLQAMFAYAADHNVVLAPLTLPGLEMPADLVEPPPPAPPLATPPNPPAPAGPPPPPFGPLPMVH